MSRTPMERNSFCAKLQRKKWKNKVKSVFNGRFQERDDLTQMPHSALFGTCPLYSQTYVNN